MWAVLDSTDPTWVLHQEWHSAFDSGSSGDGSSAPTEAEQAQPGSQPAEGAEPMDTGDTSNPQDYLPALMEHLEAQRPLEDLPAFPTDSALGVLLRAAANALGRPIHLARLDGPVPELFVYAETPGGQT